MSLRERARGRWREILTGIGIADSALTGKHQPCPSCGGTDRFRFVGDEDGGYFCGPERGDGISLVEHLFGLDFRAAAERIESVIGTDAMWKPEARVPTYPERLQTIAQPARRSHYLESRGLEMAPGLLFAREVKYFDDGQHVATYPAMLAPVTLYGRFVTFHATYLDRGSKADVRHPRKVLSGGVSGAGIALYPEAEEMGVAEGIETAIAAKMIFDFPVHSAINANGIARWKWPTVAKTVHIFADNDRNYAGHWGAWTLAHRLALRGLQAIVHFPPELGDWNDHLLAQKAAA